MSAASNRQNEYFVPRDGIDREVITADICRYLGNDALVRPGTYEVGLPSQPSPCPPVTPSPRREAPPPGYLSIIQQADGRAIQGYYITAYRNLTSVSE